MPKKSTKESFENKIKRLEEISDLLESEEIGLEKAIILYEEGIELSKVCIGTLKNTELKITELKKKLDEVTSEDEELFDDLESGDE